jgi:hypothetical protein
VSAAAGNKKRLVLAKAYLDRAKEHCDGAAVASRAPDQTLIDVDPGVERRIKGHKKILLLIGDLVRDEAIKQGVRIRRIEARPAWSHEYEERSAVVVEAEIEAGADQRFSFWEAVSERIDSLSDSLSARNRGFLNNRLSLVVSRARAL